MTCRNRTAFTLLELILMVSILGILVSIAVPRLKFDTLGRYKADTVARKIVTDLRRTRSLAISDAAVNTQGYELRQISSPKGYEIKNLHTSAVVDSQTIGDYIGVTCVCGSSFAFGPLGNQLNATSTLTISAEGRTFDITVVQATGAIKCVKN
jgi:type II secretory pathway pseudopilin PulG